MNLKEYSERAIQTALNTDKKDLAYPMLGLFGETGEVCELLKKVLRDDGGAITQNHKNSLLGELFDICWYINRICWAYDITFDQIPMWDDQFFKTQSIYDLALYLPGAADQLRLETRLQSTVGMKSATGRLLRIIGTIAEKIGYSLEEGFDQNVAKLESRKARGVLHGSGSNR